MKSIIIYSGGLDSTVLLYQLLAEGHTVQALSINYGQKHAVELERAAKITQNLKVPHEVADLSSIGKLLKNSSLTSAGLDVPEGHYAEDSMKSTVVPNRNMLMLSVAAAWAMSEKYDTVAYAAHGGDHHIYPDCREEFAQAVDQTIQLADWHKVSLYRPFVNLSKADIVKLGSELNVPFDQTWSCYKGGERHCGRCGTCIERREAFHLAGVDDPTLYDETAYPLETLIAQGWKPKTD